MSGLHRDPALHALYEAFEDRRKRWEAVYAPCAQARQQAEDEYAARSDERAAHKTAARACRRLAQMAEDAYGIGSKSLQMRLNREGLGNDLGALYDRHRDLAYAMTHPGESMPESPILAEGKTFRLCEKLIASGKYDKALNALKKQEPGFLSRTFSPERAAMKTAEIEAMREYIDTHRQWRGQLKTVEKLLPAAENDAAVALYRILKSKEWKTLSADPSKLPESVAKDPAVALLLKYRDAEVRRFGVLEKIPLIRSGILRSLRNDLENHYIETGQAISPHAIANLFHELGNTEQATVVQARTARATQGTHRRDAKILSDQASRGMEGELFTTIGGRRVDLVAALRKADESPHGVDVREKAELLEAARAVRAGWKDERLGFFEQGQPTVSHALSDRVGHGLAGLFNMAARGYDTTVRSVVKLYDATLRNEPLPFYAQPY